MDADELPFSGPFTCAMAREAGATQSQLTEWTEQRSLWRPLRGVYADVSRADDLQLRIEAARLVIPQHAVVVDRTAAWLHGLHVMRRSSAYEVPPIEVFVADGTRVRRGGLDSGLRGLLPHDVMEIGGIQVTTPLRTCLDLARLMWRYDALGAIDQYLALGLTKPELMEELRRFRGFRWVTQARALIPIGDSRAESMPESALRLHWYDALTAPPEPQLWVPDHNGVERYRLDLGSSKMRYGAEYDGAEHHTSDPDRARDAVRRAWLRDERGWEVDVFTKACVYGLDPHPVDVLRDGWERARSRRGLH